MKTETLYILIPYIIFSCILAYHATKNVQLASRKNSKSYKIERCITFAIAALFWPLFLVNFVRSKKWH